ncbi:MAG: flagellar protein FlaG [Thermoleophilia bacterium]|nr:flagellar protein FlaG [Thermoleophilia bacterium]
MDVNIVSGPNSTQGPEHAAPTRHVEGTTPESAYAARHAGRDPQIAEYLRSLPPTWRQAPHIEAENGWASVARERQPRDPKDAEPVKFDLATSDVLARFWIDEASNRVVITMYQRDTGEVIRQTPPREVLDTVAALEGRGLAVDTAN